MDKQEVASILSEHLAGYRSRSYAQLTALVHAGRVEAREVVAPSGARYQIEVQFFWDDGPSGDVRDGGIRASVPLTNTFILSPEGRFVGA